MAEPVTIAAPPQVTHTDIADFQKAVWRYYHQARRPMPWRTHPTAYNVLVSELMLQQTQVGRVLPKFEQFVAQFADFGALAAAPLEAVLRTWSGLGYNRRAKFLWQAAQKVVADFGGKLPADLQQLQTLPGIGPNTAGAILAYAFNRPVVFIETNIRTVYFYHFFKDVGQVSDAALREVVAATLDDTNPREWYWALMDYGTYLKQTQPSLLTKSKHYTKQSKFEGSRRQVRGLVLRELLEAPLAYTELIARCDRPEAADIIAELQKEGLITRNGNRCAIAAGTV